MPAGYLARPSVGYEFDWLASLNKVEEQSRMTLNTNLRPSHAHACKHAHACMHTTNTHMKIEKKVEISSDLFLLKKENHVIASPEHTVLMKARAGYRVSRPSKSLSIHW